MEEEATVGLLLCLYIDLPCGMVHICHRICHRVQCGTGVELSLSPHHGVIRLIKINCRRLEAN